MRPMARLAPFLLLCACDPAGTTATGASFGAEVDITFEGDVSFAGTVTLDRTGTLQRDQPIDVMFSRFTDPGTLNLHLLIPKTIYDGPGDYACGVDIGPSIEFPYCTVKVEHWSDRETMAQWSTQAAMEPGVFGPLADCGISVSEAGATIRGSVDCSRLESSLMNEQHPDQGRSITRVSGDWEFEPL